MRRREAKTSRSQSKMMSCIIRLKHIAVSFFACKLSTQERSSSYSSSIGRGLKTGLSGFLKRVESAKPHALAKRKPHAFDELSAAHCSAAAAASSVAPFVPVGQRRPPDCIDWVEENGRARPG
uniref:Uncharacterized protein n=1 Tax=Chrysotila carterae TaxID=13221 RepID=A0A6S9WED5_CHRCT